MKIPDEIISLIPDTIGLDDKSNALVRKLLNIIEQMAQRNQELEEENRALKDEINRLKGEKGTPKILANTPNKENDESNPPKTSKVWKKNSKKPRVKIDRTEIRRVDQNVLPPDAEHKGYRTVIIQNIKFETDNVEYKLERYYSPSEKRVYEADLPEHVDGEFGPDLKAFVVHLYFACRVPEKKIWKVLTEEGILISEGQISNIITKEKSDEFTQEKKNIFEAGMKSTNYFHIDDTGGRHGGINHYIHVICTLLFSIFFVTRYKNRKTIRNILGIKDDEVIKKVMISDDARQFWYIAFCQALCWIHEARHYKKLTPILEYHRIKLHEFLSEIWKFYNQLQEYKEHPNEKQREFLIGRFDELFSTVTGYSDLDDIIALTRKKKDRLLTILYHPEVPLHNNPAEIALREFVIKKRISYGTKSESGKIAWENMMTLLDTCRKHGVSFFDYVRDIFSNRYNMPRLAEIISQKVSQ